MSESTSGDTAGLSERIEWELAEVVGLGILGAAGLVVLVTVASAVIAAFSSPNVSGGVLPGVVAIPGPSIADTIFRSTEWATIYFPLLLLAVLGIVWWQVQSWLEVVDETEESEESDEGFRVAFEHLLRARLLDNAAMFAFCILITAAIAAVVASFIENSPGGASTILYIGETGVALATCLIASVAIWAGLRLRFSVDEAFIRAEVEGDLDEGG